MSEYTARPDGHDWVVIQSISEVARFRGVGAIERAAEYADFKNAQFEQGLPVVGQVQHMDGKPAEGEQMNKGTGVAPCVNQEQGPPKCLQTVDAQQWAQDFMRVATSAPVPKLDEGFMIGWFANAIVRGYDEGSGKLIELSKKHEALREDHGKLVDANRALYAKYEEVAQLYTDFKQHHKTVVRAFIKDVEVATARADKVEQQLGLSASCPHIKAAQRILDAGAMISKPMVVLGSGKDDYIVLEPGDGTKQAQFTGLLAKARAYGYATELQRQRQGQP